MPQIPPGDHGCHPLPDLFVVSWLGMCSPCIDSHVYVLRGQGGLLLVDCGTPWGHKRILANLAHWGLDPADIQTILLTHAHVDHASGGYLFKPGGTEILGHREIATSVECQWEAALGAQGRPCSFRMDGYLDEGDRIRRAGFEVEVLATPGHTRGCLSYLVTLGGERCLFTGDLIMVDGLPGFTGDPGFSEPDLAASLGRLGRLPFQHFCGGHAVVLEDRGDVIRRAIELHDRGAWWQPGSRLLPDTPGREPAPAER
jgi:glyoxylase-like metal-dependent hydrolase (beta-lactamase superfamily II)